MCVYLQSYHIHHLTSTPGSAGAGSLILEFGTLSRLTGDERFENAARKAFYAIWNRRSEIGLIGNTINTFTGVGTHDTFPANIMTDSTGLELDIPPNLGNRCRH